MARVYRHCAGLGVVMEQTSKRVAKIAVKVLRALHSCSGDYAYGWNSYTQGEMLRRLCTVSELKALAASALTQAPGKKGKRG